MKLDPIIDPKSPKKRKEEVAVRWYLTWNNWPINFEDWHAIAPLADIMKNEQEEQFLELKTN